MTRLTPLASLLAAAVLASATPSLHAADTNDKAARYYEDALTRYQKKDMAGAIVQLKNALQINKAMLPVQVLLGKALLANSDPVGAEVALNEALRLGVSRVEVIVPLAQAMYNQGKHNQLVESRQLDSPGLPPDIQQQLLLIKAQAFGDLGQVPKALKAIEDAKALTPQAPEPWLAEVAQRIKGRQFAEAATALERAAKLGPPSADLFFQRASLAHVQARLNEAVSAYDKTLELEPEHLDAALARVGIHVDLGRDKDAARELEALLAKKPNEPRALYLKALQAERAGDSATSKATLAQITNLMDPVPLDFIRYRPQLLLLAGLAHYGQGSLGKAKPYLEAAQRAQGPSPIAKLLARVYLEDRAPDRAVEVLESYLRTAPGDANALTLLASIHTSQGRHAKATNLMRDALSGKDNPAFRTVLGLSLLRGGKTGDAISSLEQSFKADSSQTYAGSALVTLYLREGQKAKAVAIAESMVRKAPKNPSLWMLQGTAMSRSGDAKGARQAFDTALKLSPGLPEAELGLARLEVGSRAFDAANTRLLKLYKADEKNIDVMLELANVAEMQNKPADAQRWLLKAEDNAGVGELRPGLAQVHTGMRFKNYPQALEASKKLLSKAPEDPDVMALHGRVQLLNGDVQGARSTLAGASRRAGVVVQSLLTIAELQMQARDASGANYSVEKVLSVEPNSIRGQALMAGVELQQGELAKAERRANQLAQSNPKSSVGYHLLADIALAKRQPAGAIEPLKRAQQLEPTSLGLLRLFSVQQSVEGVRAAVQSAENWLKQRPRDGQVLRAVGDAHVRNKAPDAAIKAYERALAADANDAEAMNSLASVLLTQRNTKSIALAQHAVQLDPNNPMYLDTLGWAEFQLGQSERSLPMLRDARLRNPGNAEIRWHLGAVLAKLGRHAEARAELEVAAANKQDKESAEQATKLLQTLK